jgi:hypothetical protein
METEEILPPITVASLSIVIVKYWIKPSKI